MNFKSTPLKLGGVLLIAACGNAALGLAGIESLGAAFVSMFNAAPNGTPVDAQTVPLTVSFTTDPFNP